MYCRNDPYWMKARFASICACGRQIKKGEDIYYFPRQRVAECDGCGAKSAALMDDERSNDLLCGNNY